MQFDVACSSFSRDPYRGEAAFAITTGIWFQRALDATIGIVLDLAIAQGKQAGFSQKK